MNKRKISIAVVLCLVVGGLFVSYAQPGTESDPVITLSYIKETVIPEIYEYIDSKISNKPSQTVAEQTFVVAEAPEGKKIICEAGSELILRSGKAEIIATEKGGIADTTAGTDLPNGAEAPKNHLLIVPVDDGRGMEMKTDCILMIKGEYSVK